MTATRQKDDVVAKIVAIVRQQLPEQAASIGPHTSLTADLALDSLQQMTLVVELENSFEVCLNLDPESQQKDSLVDLAEVIIIARSQQAGDS